MQIAMPIISAKVLLATAPSYRSLVGRTASSVLAADTHSSISAYGVAAPVQFAVAGCGQTALVFLWHGVRAQF
jgi:hypothetical protein